MARGRRHVPPSTEVGIWFQHRGSHSASAAQRKDATSTGSMLAGPFRAGSAQVPQPPPNLFNTKSERNYRAANKFSEHDNRNAFQDHGIYFGDEYTAPCVRPPWMYSSVDKIRPSWLSSSADSLGQTTRQLGRNLKDPHLRLHNTGKDFLKHNGRDVTDYDYYSTYNKSYLGKDTEQPPVHRRFTKSLPPADPGKVSLTTATTDWQPTERAEHKTSTQVLAVSQEPFLKHNPWQYSYHSKRNVYPPYDRRSDPIIDNMFNRYGAAFNSSSNFNSTGFTGLSSMETTGCS